MGKTIRGARKGKNSIFTAHTRLRKGPVRLRKIDYAEKCAGRVPLSRLFDRPIGATAARQIPVLKVTCSNHVSVTAALSLGGPGVDFSSTAVSRRSGSIPSGLRLLDWCSGYHVCFTRSRSPVRARYPVESVGESARGHAGHAFFPTRREGYVKGVVKAIVHESGRAARPSRRSSSRMRTGIRGIRSSSSRPRACTRARSCTAAPRRSWRSATCCR